MKAVTVIWPGTNREHDIIHALQLSGFEVSKVWHTETELPADTDLIVLPGGFSYGDYLRSGAIAARSPVMESVKAEAGRGMPVFGVCNGFQILIECGLLPGALMRNAGQKFICKRIGLITENNATIFSSGFSAGQEWESPIAHHDGNYFAEPETLQELEDNGRIVFRYADNPNGSINDIAGITNEQGTILGMMPHPENATDTELGSGTDGRILFDGLFASLN